MSRVYTSVILLVQDTQFTMHCCKFLNEVLSPENYRQRLIEGRSPSAADSTDAGPWQDDSIIMRIFNR